MDNGEKQAIDTMVYRTSEIERITELAIKAASLLTEEYAQSTKPMFSKPQSFGVKLL